MIPNFNDIGNLPAGMHQATWEEFYERFGYTPHRRKLLDGLELAMRQLRDVGCKCIWVDGSFVTAKERPGDYDACFLEDGMDDWPIIELKTCFLDSTSERQLKRYGGEFFSSTLIVGSDDKIPRRKYLEYFQSDDDDIPKGIIEIRL